MLFGSLISYFSLATELGYLYLSMLLKKGCEVARTSAVENVGLGMRMTDNGLRATTDSFRTAVRINYCEPRSPHL